MSDYIDTREGWREVGDEDAFPAGSVVLHEFTIGQRDTRRWVREVPVPPLPTAPYTVIRVTNAIPAGLIGQVLTLYPDSPDEWCNQGWNIASTEQVITAFELVSEPRAVTAKAVLDRVVETAILVRRDQIEPIREEFGVDQ